MRGVRGCDLIGAQHLEHRDLIAELGKRFDQAI